MTISDALRVLADLIASGLSIRDALASWHEHVDGPLRNSVQSVSARVRLGADYCTTLEPLDPPDARMLAAILQLCGSAGGSATPPLRDLADSIERREARRRNAQAAAAAARASNLLLQGLPGAVVALLALSGAPIFDGLGSGLLASGVSVALVGTRWIERLTPSAPADDAAVTAAGLASVLLRAGAQLDGALHEVALAGNDPDLRLVRSWVVLGRSWPAALGATSDEGLVALGYVIRRSRATGVPVADALDHFVATRRAHWDLAFERAVRAAPVKMVVPLVACGLPAFCLLVVGPLVRSLPGT